MAYFDRAGGGYRTPRDLMDGRDPERLPGEDVPIDRQPEFPMPVPPPTLPPPMPRAPTPVPRAPVPRAGGGGRRGPRRAEDVWTVGPTGLGGGTFATPQSPRSMVPFRTTEFPRARGAAPFGFGWGSNTAQEPEDDEVNRYLRGGGRAVL